jgi:hypothetical protein
LKLIMIIDRSEGYGKRSSRAMAVRTWHRVSNVRSYAVPFHYL